MAKKLNPKPNPTALPDVWAVLWLSGTEWRVWSVAKSEREAGLLAAEISGRIVRYSPAPAVP